MGESGWLTRRSDMRLAIWIRTSKTTPMLRQLRSKPCPRMSRTCAPGTKSKVVNPRFNKFASASALPVWRSLAAAIKYLWPKQNNYHDRYFADWEDVLDSLFARDLRRVAFRSRKRREAFMYDGRWRSRHYGYRSVDMATSQVRCLCDNITISVSCRAQVSGLSTAAPQISPTVNPSGKGSSGSTTY
jgi:hypothetical protein